MDPKVKSGEVVVLKKCFQDKGDEDLTFICVEDEYSDRLKVSPIVDLPFPPVYLVSLNMLEGF